MESLFGVELPTAGKVVVAFLVVIGLIGAIAWAVRRFGAERFGGSAGRGRQPRLAVIDAAAVDGRRRLVLVRRDNVEHLLMIGGPTDLVVEPNIVRAMGAPRDLPRDTPPSRVAAVSETLPRAVPLGEGTMWPLQPQPQPEAAPRQQRAVVVEESLQWTLQPQPEPELLRTPRPAEPLAGLAEELAHRPSPPRDFSVSGARPAPTPEPSRAAAPQTPPPAEFQQGPSGDQNLAEMAHRLEAALRRPNDGRPSADIPAKPESKEGAPASAEPSGSRSSKTDTARPAAAEPKPAPARMEPKPSQPKSLYDSLEQEMASLLGRPSGKP
jgi:hypothetical protein